MRKGKFGDVKPPKLRKCACGGFGKHSQAALVEPKLNGSQWKLSQAETPGVCSAPWYAGAHSQLDLPRSSLRAQAGPGPSSAGLPALGGANAIPSPHSVCLSTPSWRSWESPSSTRRS